MSVEQQKDTSKKVVKDVQTKEFVKLQDLTKEMFEALPTIMVKLDHQVSRKGYARDTISFDLHELLPIVMQIKTVEYNLMRIRLRLELKDSRGKDKFTYNLPVRYRFVKGKNEYSEYKSIELIFGQYVYKTYFFNDYSEQQILEDLEKSGELKIDWYVRPDQINLADTINSSWD